MSQAWAQGQAEAQQATPASAQSNVEQLAQQLKNEPLNAGLRVDLILALCQEGQRGQALSVLNDLQALGSLPEGIEQLLTQLFSKGCPQAAGTKPGVASINSVAPMNPTLAAPSAFLQASSFFGWASNVNAAPKPEGIALGEAGSLGYFTFAPSSRPQASHFAELGLDYSMAAPVLQVAGLGLGVPRLSLSASARGYGSASSFNTVFVAGQLAWPVQGQQSLQLQLSHWQLGGLGYETSWGVMYERHSQPWSGWLGSGAKGFWGVNVEQTQVLQDGRFDANRLALHIGASYGLAKVESGQGPGARGLWAWSVGPVYEESVFHRPGGHRLGVKAKALLQLPNRMGQARVSLSAGLLNDQDVYNQTLFGGVKRQRRQLELALQQTFRPISGLQPFMGLSWANTKDTINLFTVESLQVHLGISQAW